VTRTAVLRDRIDAVLMTDAERFNSAAPSSSAIIISIGWLAFCGST
jgi:hypothetical protein